jgi:virulence factor
VIRVAIIGLGDIAHKAYLPVLSARAGLELHLVTRNRDTLHALGEKYRIPHRHETLESLLATGVDAALVHAATSAHPTIVESLLRAGVAVYVDKPLADNLATCEHLVELAEAAGRTLMVGFNRRYAPAYTSLLNCPRDIILMEKNRARLPETPRRVIFDDFIHVVDTLRMLLPEAIERRAVEAHVADGQVHHVVLSLAGPSFTALGIMNRMSGADEEFVEVMGKGTKRRVTSLGEIIDYGSPDRLSHRPDWKPATWLRGIEQICDAFLASVRSGQSLSARDALATHAMCEWITNEVEALLGRSDQPSPSSV